MIHSPADRDDAAVLIVALAADTPDTGWTVTTTIATFTAGVSVLTLVVTTYAAGRRDRVKWAREELAAAFYEFVNASYAASHASYEHQKAVWGHPDSPPVNETEAELWTQLLAVRHAQTKIRLLAPRRTVERADDVRFKLSDLQKSIVRTMTYDEHHRHRVLVAEARERLMSAAKRDMALPR